MAPLLHTVAAAILVGLAPFAQGDTGFTRGSGRADVVVSFGQDDYEEEPLFPGNALDVRRRSWSTYAAVGLSDDLDLVVTAAYAEAKITRFEPDVPFEFSRENSDWQDASVGLKWRLGGVDAWGGRLSLLAAPAVKFAVKDYNDGLGGGTLGQRLSLGAEQTDWRARWIGHYQSRSGGFWASLETGYDVREDEPGDEIPIHLVLGIALFDYRLTLMPFYSYIDNLDEAAEIQGAVSAAGSDIQRYGLHAYGAITSSFGLVANYHTTDDGRGTGRIPGFSLGLVWRL
ncbi:MAG: hypothetical protein WD226_12630 [Planctomycetota bacterium]